MKRVKLSLLGLLLVICLSSCGQSKTEDMNHVELTSESNGKESKAPDDRVDTEISSVTSKNTWDEITENGVDEDALWKNVDQDILEYVATEIQTLVAEEEKAERENQELVLMEGWVRVFESERYHNVVNMGEKAMKPLYWIIYKSPNAGMYEYICASAFYEISGYDFTKENGELTWSTSKEFIEVFNEQILSERK